MNPFQYIERYIEDGVGVIKLNRPKQLNALNRKMVSEIITALEEFDHNDEVSYDFSDRKWSCFFRRGRY